MSLRLRVCRLASKKRTQKSYSAVYRHILPGRDSIDSKRLSALCALLDFTGQLMVSRRKISPEGIRVHPCARCLFPRVTLYPSNSRLSVIVAVDPALYIAVCTVMRSPVEEPNYALGYRDVEGLLPPIWY